MLAVKMFSAFYFCILLGSTLKLLSTVAGKCAESDLVQITIGQGTLRGRSLTTEAGVNYYSFQGIPYAKPPIGELRFKPPQPPLPWEGVRDATQEGSICPQYFRSPTVISGNEDCLFLNVYSPQLPSDVPPNLPVMLWIHGGGLSKGSGGTYMFGPEYLMNTRDIILVTINYRLGVLGFLGLNMSDFSKNNGMKDQVAALKWVKNNIAQFGGNPNDITIFGESSGAVSVHYHLLSPLSKGLFHKAISQSGSAIQYIAYVDPLTAHERALTVAKILNFNTSDLSSMLDSLRNADAYDLVKAGTSIPNPPSFPVSPGGTLLFGATTETGKNAFLPDTPLNIIKSGKFNQVPYIIGVNSAEGKRLGTDALANSSQFDYYNDNFELLFVPPQLNLELGSPESLKVAAEIKETYLGNRSISEDTVVEFVNLESDSGMVSAVYRSIKLHLATSNTPIYFYWFSYVGKLSLSEIFGSSKYSFLGASHADELGYLFKMYRFNVTAEQGSSEMLTIQRMTKLWTSFAKSGIPSFKTDISWKPLNDNHTYLNIGEKLRIEDFNDFEPKQMTLWSTLFKDIDALDNQTYKPYVCDKIV